jgi:AcrR family transcriptional regulator
MTGMPSAERRVRVLCAAVAEFARAGYDATTTAAIAQRCEVSQPYLFKLFPSKRDLFLAAAELCFRAWRDLLAEAADGLAGQPALDAMARACCEADWTDELFVFPLRLYAAGHDPRLAEASRRQIADLRDAIVRAAGVDDERTDRAFATVLMTQTAVHLGTHSPALHRAVRAFADISGEA